MNFTPAVKAKPVFAQIVHILTPELIVSLRQGYSLTRLRYDALAGITVAIIALPLAMALAIASGATPQQGLVTGVVAGFLISALGGSRYVVGGPTRRVRCRRFNVIQQHGYDGLVLATLLAGLMLITAGLARLGSWIKYIRCPSSPGSPRALPSSSRQARSASCSGSIPTACPATSSAKCASTSTVSTSST
jgi:SulP family sulfate permease